MGVKHIMALFFIFPAIGLCAKPAAPDSGETFMYNKRFFEAATWYKARIDKGGNVFDMHRAYQDALYAGKDSMALRTLEQAYADLHREAPDNQEYTYLYARCLPCSTGKKYFTQALEKDSCYAWAMNGMGACAFESADFENAKTYFLRSIQCNPDFYLAYNNLALVYKAEENEQKTKAVYKKMIARNRRQPQGYEWIGNFYLENKNFNEAIQAYEKSIQYGNDGPGVYFKLGYVSFQRKLYQKAISAYQKSIAAGNSTYEVYYNLGTVLELTNFPEEALGNYEKACATEKNYRVLYAMGNCAVLLGLYSKAIQCYGDFLKSEPENTEALFGLANAYHIKKDFQAAIDMYLRIIAIDKNFTKAYYNLGSIYAYHLKDKIKMALYWQSVVSLAPGSDDAAFVSREMKKNGLEQ
ncbi:MAG: hypothetical protein A2268_12215 [Candidatus Raymondbacteria bacterium RifOxyA12_full_50_37]|uniref:Uncharacterized protein n=1 Tax=Candidatus Raymondbacteria bacterium RIFOXYD12_FULL_49_13 TaxID=1817890 RepID=A0A1F7F2L8_UNCRA|nr:MAG: hypothetical protein A2268_12215 [Candidatus Raymondbacteria bacterium RifOxyA12_full_50_37]OGJ90307.1 MAG: hypothetical protein A2248_00100 [Candidatus Raymondbacteria bacterium RIFOXYA2_FULL_49_16]OGJ97297.1 MAG: hypothetical protein A2453_01560 [Candidatus Raymondbacteria bacterium RIFOXYC2_FULL_50_21]OGK00910.1 MAG: hypothetical protein A2519_12730 [Candidatus Raymondbacteria bacterium RIFOXYD12_FULL_49_13]OGP43119.1 MAG: hypothetical protein A2324_19325 [Candidatus Raymondbacteria 